MQVHDCRKINLLAKKKFFWKKFWFKSEVVWYNGDKDFILSILKGFDKLLPTPNSVSKKLKNNKNTSVMFVGKRFSLIFTNFSRSHVIFFEKQKKELNISNDSNEFKKTTSSISTESLRQLVICTYVLGHNTIYKNIKCMKPGEFILMTEKKCYFSEYFQYHKTFQKINVKKKNYLVKLDDVINGIFSRLTKKLKDKNIFVPLSGGFDSRLVLAKLHEHGYKNIKCFSYGLKNNSDALIAKKVSKMMGVEWFFIDIQGTEYRYFYNSKEKKDFDKFSDNLQVLPNYQDFLVIKKMKKLKIIDKNSVIINGQSGDFNSGNHIPENLFNHPNLRNFKQEIKKKHLYPIKSTNNNDNEIYIDRLLDKVIKSSENKNIKPFDLFEKWEYEERQSKYVVNGQKVYEFHKINWELPLWDGDFVKFWTTVPGRYRFKQNLFREYLMQWNYSKVFNLKIDITSHTGFIYLFLRILSFTLNSLSFLVDKKFFIQYFDYFSRYGFSYRYFGFINFLLKRNKIKNPFGLHLLSWLEDKKLIQLIKKEELL